MKIPASFYEKLSKIKNLVILKKQLDEVGFRVLRRRQKETARKRNYKPHPLSHSYRFCILTVKRTKYVDLAIEQINSLHFFNPYHVFDILCDSVCFKYLEENLHRIDYPDRIGKIKIVSEAKEPWQIYKIHALLHAIDVDGVLLDADMYWFSDPLIRQWKALLYTKAYDIKDVDRERRIVSNVFKHPEWNEFSHYVTALVYLPYRLCTQDIRSQLLKYTKSLTSNPYEFLSSALDREAARRLAEEIAINLVLQSNLDEDQITTLKTHDWPGNTEVVQALYFGAMNQIVE